MPDWNAAAQGARAPYADDFDTGEWRKGWQYHACSAREQYYSEHAVIPSSSSSRRAMLLSQAGFGASRWLSAIPYSAATCMKPLRMLVALRRRLRWPMPLGPRRCGGTGCGHDLDALGDHWASCMRTGRVRRRARPLERTWARVFREAGGRVLENVFLRDMGIAGIHAADSRRLEVVATGLPLSRGVPLAVDATMVSALHCDGSPWTDADSVPGVAIRRAEKNKGVTYPELVQSETAVLVTLACETSGRWSSQCAQVIDELAAARARSAPRHLQLSARLGYARRWWALLSIAQQDCFAGTLVDDGVLLLDGHDAHLPEVVDVVMDERC